MKMVEQTKKLSSTRISIVDAATSYLKCDDWSRGKVIQFISSNGQCSETVYFKL